MTLRTMILVLPLGLSLGSFEATAQEGAARTEPASKAAAALARTDWRAAGKDGAVAAGGLGAVEAGLDILKAGGNAADSAAATIFALSVTDSRSFCFGGEVPILVLRRQAPDRNRHRRPGRCPPAGDPRPLQRHRRHSRKGNRARGRARRT